MLAKKITRGACPQAQALFISLCMVEEKSEVFFVVAVIEINFLPELFGHLKNATAIKIKKGSTFGILSNNVLLFYYKTKTICSRK